jgi:hypothetical protein
MQVSKLCFARHATIKRVSRDEAEMEFEVDQRMLETIAAQTFKALGVDRGRVSIKLSFAPVIV